MNIIVKHYDELTKDELYEILETRINVFVVEQECPYPEIDGKDKNAYHVMGYEDNKLIAYLRVLDKGVSYENVSLGRVLTLNRRQGYGSELLRKGIEVAKEKFHADCIKIEAQTYAKQFYGECQPKCVSS